LRNTTSSTDPSNTTLSNNVNLVNSISSLFNFTQPSSDPTKAQPFVPNLGNFPTSGIVAQASADILRRSVSPIDYYPSYENSGSLAKEQIRYITSSQLQANDRVRVYKTYHDINGGVLKK